MTTPTKTSEYRNSPSGSLSVMDYLAKVVGLDVDLQEVTTHNDIYPFIDPAPHFSARTFAKKVVLITGGSRGIGLSIAQHFARAGASLALVARDESVLETTKADIERDVTGARVLALPCDVRDSAQVSKAVASTVEHFGRLDVLVANAAVILPFGTLLGGVDPDAWWKTCEVGLRGAWNFIHFAVPHLQKSQGYVIAMTSVSGHLRLPTGSDSCIMKLALGRLIEFVPIEYPEIKTFAVHPGSVLTDIALRSNAPIPFDTKPELPASKMLHLAAGKADWLNGRYVSAQWDLGVVEQKYKTAIVEKNALVQKLALP